MILTQSYAEAQLPGLEPVGIYHDFEELSTPQGYGLPVAEHLEKLAANLRERHPKHVLLRARIKVTPGSSHASYNRLCVSITGDLYRSLAAAE